LSKAIKENKDIKKRKGKRSTYMIVEIVIHLQEDCLSLEDARSTILNL